MCSPWRMQVNMCVYIYIYRYRLALYSFDWRRPFFAEHSLGSRNFRKPHIFLVRDCGYPLLCCWDVLKQHANFNSASDLGDSQRQIQGETTETLLSKLRDAALWGYWLAWTPSLSPLLLRDSRETFAQKAFAHASWDKTVSGRNRPTADAGFCLDKFGEVGWRLWESWRVVFELAPKESPAPPTGGYSIHIELTVHDLRMSVCLSHTPAQLSLL